ncbi:MAG: hypothetical protein J6T86_04270 [Bacteroidales bacterium]|nr:hypothetical protein [Bacteroidales bacterium]
MKKILFILTTLILSSFSLSAQWTCKTLDPEFDDAERIAYTEENNRAQLMIGEWMPFFDYSIWCSDFQSFDDKIFKLINRISNGRYAGEEVLHFLSELDESYESDFLSMSCVNAINQHVDDDESFGNIPLILAVDHYRKLQAPYRFDISLKVGTGYNHYKSDMDFNVSYVWSENEKVGYYRIEWLSRDFWSDFRAASSVKIRIKQNRDSDYQYYEFSMSGSSKAFNFVTLGHKVVWMDDVAECLIKVFEVMKAKEAQKQESTKPDWQSEFEAEKQRYMASHTPPHELKLECKSRHLSMEHPHFELYPLSNSVICDSRYDFFDVGYDTILNMLNLCPCLDDQISDIDMNHELYSKSFDWNLDGIHILGNDSKEIVVPFESIPQYKWDKRYCASLYFGDNAALWGTEAIDSLEKYQLIWTQNPLKLIVKEHDKTLEFVVQDWGVDGEWMHGHYNFNWYYRVLSEYGEEYVVSFDDYVKDWDDIENVEYLTNIGNVLLFDHWKNKIPANIFFRHTDMHAYDVFEIKK